MIFKFLGVIVDILISPTEPDQTQKLNVNLDDGYTDATYDDGNGNEYHRDSDGQLRDWTRSEPDDW